MKVIIPKKVMYSHFGLDAAIHSQYAKRAQYINMQFKATPEENLPKVDSELTRNSLY